MRENYKSFKGTNLTVDEGTDPVSRTTSEEKVGGGRWGRRFPTDSSRIDVGVCYTRGARSRRLCGVVEKEGALGAGGGIRTTAWMARK